MSKWWESKQHALDRALITRDLQPGGALNAFIAPKKPRTWGDVAKDTGEVVWDAAYEGVAKDVVYEGLVKGVVIGGPKALWGLVRPQAATPAAQAPTTPAPPVAGLPTADAADAAGDASAHAGCQPLSEIELQRRKSLFQQRSKAYSRSGSGSGSASAARRMRPLVGSFKAPAAGADDAAAQHRRELYQNVSLRRSGSQRFQPTPFTDPQVAEDEERFVPAGAGDIADQLKGGATLVSNVPNALGVVRAGSTVVPVRVGPANGGWHKDVTLPFDVACDAPVMHQLLAAILKDAALPDDVDLSVPATLALRMRGPDFQSEVADPVMRLGKVQQSTRASGEAVAIDEQVFFTLFDGLLRRGADGVGAEATVDGKSVYDFLADAQSVAFASTNEPLARFLNARMQSEDTTVRDLRMRLALFEVAKLNYFENAQIKEATKEFLAGTIVGATGELAIEFIPEVNKKANFDPVTYVLNVLFGGGVDFIDNYKGRMGAVTMGAANADAATVAQQRRAALKASACGAAYGTLANFLGQWPIALKVVSPGWLMAGTAISIVGSSLSIPFQMQSDRVRKTATAIGLLKRGIATLPAPVLGRAVAEAGLPPAAPGATALAEHRRLAAALSGRGGDVEALDVPWQNSHAVKAWAEDIAVSDMSMSLASVSSTAGFMAAPLLSSFWTINFASSHIRTALQSIIFGISPGAENLSTAGAAVGVSARAHGQINAAALAAMAMAAKGTERSDLDTDQHTRQARATMGAVTKGVTYGLSKFGGINVLKQRSLL